MLALAREASIIFAINDENRIMLASVATETWESACLGDAHPTRAAALERLAMSLKPDAVVTDPELAQVVARNAEQRAMIARANEADRVARDARVAAEHDRREALRGKLLAGARFKRQSIAPHMREGLEPETVDAFVYQGLAVHRKAGCGSDWYITQASSGLGLGIKFALLADARIAAARLAGLVDWVTAKPNSLTSNLAVRDMVSRIRHGDPLA
jgi:hypothetical protein